MEMAHPIKEALVQAESGLMIKMFIKNLFNPFF
jgi:hypothetical protein